MIKTEDLTKSFDSFLAVDKINLEDLFFNDLSDLHIIHHRHSDHLFLVTLCDLVALKELLSGTKVMLELNETWEDRVLNLDLNTFVKKLLTYL